MWRAQTWQSPALSLHCCSTTFQQGELGHLTHVIFPFSKYRRTNASQRFEVRIKEVTLINYLAHKDAQVIMLFFCSLHLSPGTAVFFFFFWKCGNKISLGCWNQQVFKWVEKSSVWSMLFIFTSGSRGCKAWVDLGGMGSFSNEFCLDLSL